VQTKVNNNLETSETHSLINTFVEDILGPLTSKLASVSFNTTTSVPGVLKILAALPATRHCAE
jgi:hypothetical protein